MFNKFSIINKIYAVLMIFAIVCTVILGVARAQHERQLNTVDLVLDYEELVALAEQSDHDVSWWLEKFHSVGFENVALKETTFENLLNYGVPMTAMMRNEWLQSVGFHIGVGEKTRDVIETGDKFDYIVTIKDSYFYDVIKEELLKRYPLKFMYFDDDFNMIVFDGKAEDGLYLQDGLLKDEEGKSKRSVRELVDSKIAWLGLGFFDIDITIIKKAGMKPLLRPSNFPRYSDKLIEAFDDVCKKYDCNPEYLIFQGDSVFGYDMETDEPEDTYRYMYDNDIAVGLVESGVQRGHSKQKGIKDLVKMLDYRAVRVLPIVGYIQKRYEWYGYEGAEEIENTIYRAITERNIRSIYFRPFREQDNDIVYITEWEPYEEMFNRLEKRLIPHHIKFGEASYMSPNMPHPMLIAGISYGLIAIGMFLFTRYIWIFDKLKYILLVISIIISTAAAYLVPNAWSLLLAILTSVLMPVFVAMLLCKILNRFIIKKLYERSSIMIRKSSVSAYLILIISLILGGLSLGALLSHSNYLLEIKYFRGVKISQLLPLIIFIGVYILEMSSFIFYNNENSSCKSTDDCKYQNWKYVKKILFEDIKLVHLVILGAVGLVGIVYIARTGHETKIQPSSIEMLIRNTLELKLLARPRTKEMFIAFPALYILLTRMAQNKKRGAFILALISMLGFTSVLNTFSHLRTPLYISIARTFYSMVFGLIIGSVALVILNIISSIWSKYINSYNLSLMTEDNNEESKEAEHV